MEALNSVGWFIWHIILNSAHTHTHTQLLNKQHCSFFFLFIFFFFYFCQHFVSIFIIIIWNSCQPKRHTKSCIRNHENVIFKMIELIFIVVATEYIIKKKYAQINISLRTPIKTSGKCKSSWSVAVQLFCYDYCRCWMFY